ncbi:fimbria/pilus outer membrane usher protein, partial [Pantoea agglomerans]
MGAGRSERIGFSKYLETTGTDVTLAAWRYSSNGFYSLRDAALERYGVR